MKSNVTTTLGVAISSCAILKRNNVFRMAAAKYFKHTMEDSEFSKFIRIIESEENISLENWLDTYILHHDVCYNELLEISNKLKKIYVVNNNFGKLNNIFAIRTGKINNEYFYPIIIKDERASDIILDRIIWGVSRTECILYGLLYLYNNNLEDNYDRSDLGIHDCELDDNSILFVHGSICYDYFNKGISLDRIIDGLML